MADHDNGFLKTLGTEKLSVADRLQQARKRRTQQLKKYAQYEKQLQKETGKKRKQIPMPRSAKVKFSRNIVILEAASRNDIDEVREMLLAGIDPNIGNNDGLTALHQSCIDNSEDIVRLLIEFGANINVCDSELWTPLHAAATCGFVHLCKYLVERGADLLSVNGDGNMPYDICEHDATLDYIESEMAKRGITQEIIEETRLLPERTMLADLKLRSENGTSLQFRGPIGETPLHIAAANGFVDVAHFLLEHHVSLNVTDHDLWQPIHCAAFWCQLPVMEILLQHGASLDVRTRTGETALEICPDVDTRQRILELKKEVDSSSRNFKSRKLSRQRSSSMRRSSSVRRSSMKEKKALSQKEAREEGRRLQKAVMQNDEENDDQNPGESHDDLSGDNYSADQVHESFSVSQFSTNVMTSLKPSSSDEYINNLLRPSCLKKPSVGSEMSGNKKSQLSSSPRRRFFSRKPPSESIGTSTHVDQEGIELFEDTVKRSDTTAPLICKSFDKEPSNGTTRHEDDEFVSYDGGILTGRRSGCLKSCCIVL